MQRKRRKERKNIKKRGNKEQNLNIMKGEVQKKSTFWIKI